MMLGSKLQLSPSTSPQQNNYLRKPTSYHRHRKIAVKPRNRNEVFWIDYKDPNQKEDNTPFRFTGKERDLETGLYYYGARYLDPKTSRWMSTDPAMGEYIPSPGQDIGKLSGMGGVFNTINMHTYHYAANNPLKYTDPDGRRTKNQIYKGIIKAVTAEFVKEVLGQKGEKAYNKASFFKIPGYNSGVSLPNGKIGLSADIIEYPTGSLDGKNTLVHEVFHQMQYKNDPKAKGILLNELKLQNIEKIDVYALGRIISNDKDLKTLPLNDLQNYSSLSDIPFYESRAQLVGDFAQLYSRAKRDEILNDYEKTAMKHAANIMLNSNIDSDAARWVINNYPNY